jgi:hypothetical protein
MGAYLEKLTKGFLQMLSSYKTQKPFSKLRIGWEYMGGSITRIYPNCIKTPIFEDLS